MKVVQAVDENGVKTTSLNENGNSIIIYTNTDGDIYWLSKNDGVKEKVLVTVDRENYPLYSAFDFLYSSIEKAKIRERRYRRHQFQSFEQLFEDQAKIANRSNEYRKENTYHYADLFDEKSNTISWHSDNDEYENADILTITKKDDKFIIELHQKDNIENLEDSNLISVCIKNKNSYYKPFNIVFEKMQKKLQKIDDVNDLYHQMHFFEYEYEREKYKNKKYR